MDDVLNFSTSWREHCEHIREVFRRLRDAGLTAKPSKGQFSLAECVYLGHIMGNGRVRPEKSKVEAIQSFPVPTTKKEVRSFMGLAGYYRKSVPDYASLATPITDLTKKNSLNRVVWSAACEQAFM